MTIPLANYQEQIEAFLALLRPDCERRILLFQGEGGTGKTTLFRACQEKIPQDVYHVPIQLRQSGVGMAEIFSRSVSLTGWDRWPNFTERVLGMTPNIEIEDNQLRGLNNRINVALHVESPADRKQRRVDLTEAWFTDTYALPQPLLMMMDVYEQAPIEVADWIDGPFLARAAYCERLRVVVAGRKVPDENTIEWGHCCTRQNLYGVREARYWLPVVAALGKVVPAKNPLDFMAGACNICQGRPDEIMKWIMEFPSREPEAVL